MFEEVYVSHQDVALISEKRLETSRVHDQKYEQRKPTKKNQTKSNIDGMDG